MNEYDEKLKQIEESRFQLVFCERFDEKSDIWNLNQHQHSYMEILYFIDGSAEVRIEEEKTHVSLYNLVVYPRETVHQESYDFAHHQEVICIGVNSTNFQLVSNLQVTDTNGWLYSLLSLILDEYKNDYRNHHIINHYIKILFINLIRADLQKEKTDIDLIIQYINHHFTRALSIRELASLIHVSESYLIRSFKKRTGETPIQYLNKLKVKAAMRLLTDPKNTIDDISQRLGFVSVKYFSKLFKKYTASAPTEYRSKL